MVSSKGMFDVLLNKEIWNNMSKRAQTQPPVTRGRQETFWKKYETIRFNAITASQVPEHICFWKWVIGEHEKMIKNTVSFIFLL